METGEVIRVGITVRVSSEFYCARKSTGIATRETCSESGGNGRRIVAASPVHSAAPHALPVPTSVIPTRASIIQMATILSTLSQNCFKAL